ncbi:unnamed protein product [Ixodes pacificus]
MCSIHICNKPADSQQNMWSQNELALENSIPIGSLFFFVTLKISQLATEAKPMFMLSNKSQTPFRLSVPKQN